MRTRAPRPARLLRLGACHSPRRGGECGLRCTPRAGGSAGNSASALPLPRSLLSRHSLGAGDTHQGLGAPHFGVGGICSSRVRAAGCILGRLCRRRRTVRPGECPTPGTAELGGWCRATAPIFAPAAVARAVRGQRGCALRSSVPLEGSLSPASQSGRKRGLSAHFRGSTLPEYWLLIWTNISPRGYQTIYAVPVSQRERERNHSILHQRRLTNVWKIVKKIHAVLLPTK
ncbi:uncharacterized protein LOC124507543 [Lynx rufus]|uniref:uncharacterized protein LOC124507543 n=1 Tax=Lynx rufus TaxID=61384 RepID=UPI001F126666|nr:uncharacterized protein LOC124507543 [Lynx rufus]